MSTIKISLQEYVVPELGFGHSKKLEAYGVPLRRMLDPDLMFTIVSAFVAIIVGCLPHEADFLIEKHIEDGGEIEPIFEAYTQAMIDSRFFKKLLENQEKKLLAAKAVTMK